jgi:hypothetical protein
MKRLFTHELGFSSSKVVRNRASFVRSMSASHGHGHGPSHHAGEHHEGSPELNAYESTVASYPGTTVSWCG